MAVTSSPRLGLTRWSAGTDAFRRAQLDADHATLDAIVALYVQGTFNARPAAGIEGRFYYATDTGLVYYDDGAAWHSTGFSLATTAALALAAAGSAGAATTAARADHVHPYPTPAQIGAATPAQIVTDHGALTGLGDDDHPQYLNNARGDARYLPLGGKAADSDLLDGLDSTAFLRQALATAKGDLLVATAAGVLARLGVGAGGTVLTADAAQAAGMKWAALPAYAQMVSGSYTGDGTASRFIALPFDPKFVHISDSGDWALSPPPGSTGGPAINYYGSGAVVGTGINQRPGLGTGGFYVSNSGGSRLNAPGAVNYYLAIG